MPIQRFATQVADLITKRIASLINSTIPSASSLETLLVLQGRSLALANKKRSPLQNIHDAEFKVFSQYGEDGIIQYLISQSSIQSHEQAFIEFGVQNYTESNTRFLLISDQWRGLIIDGDEEYIKSVQRSDIYWRYNLTALCKWIDRDNINSIISSAGFSGDIGLLSIDIDGNDYWVWERIKVVNPVIVVVEWNSVLGPRHALSVPYDPAFNRPEAHYSCLYWGASISAFYKLALNKGYSLICSNRIGNNLFFVRNDRLGNLVPLTPEKAYIESNFRDSRDSNGNLTFMSGPDRATIIQDLPFIDVDNSETVTIAQLNSTAF
ncbi:hypothetical protein [Synechococcus sp. Cu2B8-bc1011]|uniref:hypothetical protein n=1 Tax=Synechococcus sp. Cu2B8-bc1011 TaxID=3093725 RepID=UPI0039B00DF1